MNCFTLEDLERYADKIDALIAERDRYYLHLQKLVDALTMNTRALRLYMSDGVEMTYRDAKRLLETSVHSGEYIRALEEIAEIARTVSIPHNPVKANRLRQALDRADRER